MLKGSTKKSYSSYEPDSLSLFPRDSSKGTDCKVILQRYGNCCCIPKRKETANDLSYLHSLGEEQNDKRQEYPSSKIAFSCQTSVSPLRISG